MLDSSAPCSERHIQELYVSPHWDANLIGEQKLQPSMLQLEPAAYEGGSDAVWWSGARSTHQVLSRFQRWPNSCLTNITFPSQNIGLYICIYIVVFSLHARSSDLRFLCGHYDRKYSKPISKPSTYFQSNPSRTREEWLRIWYCNNTIENTWNLGSSTSVQFSLKLSLQRSYLPQHRFPAVDTYGAFTHFRNLTQNTRRIYEHA